MIRTPLPRSTPEAEGISSENVEAFVASMEDAAKRGVQIHEFVLMRHGKVISEGAFAPYPKHAAHELFSLSKSFVSLAAGIAQGEGLLSIDDPLVKFFPEYDSPKISGRMRRVTLRNLLTMASGHDACAIGRYRHDADGSDWVRNFLEDELPLEPGSKFVYNSGATFMLSATIQKVTGLRVSEYLRPRLFDPLGFGEVRWDRNPDGIDLGGWGMLVSAEEIAAFAQMMLQGGVWNGKRIVPRDYYEAAISKQIPNNQNQPDSQPDWKQGYGFQFWRCRRNCYRGDGYAGQIALMMPECGIALAITAGSTDIQAELDLVFSQIAPHLSDTALPEDAAALESLRKRESGLLIPAFANAAAAAFAPDPQSPVFGSHELAPNVASIAHAAVSRLADGVRIEWTRQGKTAVFTAPYEGVAVTRTDFIRDDTDVAASARWLSADELEVVAFPIGTPSLCVMRFKNTPAGIAYSHRTPIWFRQENALEINAATK